ncbi:hypothetical protein ACJJTC_008065 [Scirpophaga incertulas]
MLFNRNFAKRSIKVLNFFYRYKLHRNKSSLGLWHEDITTDIKLKIENHWSKNIVSLEKCDENQPFYVLPMFPYPSGNLHMGHVRVYSISDTIARMFKMHGKHVIHPIGWDAFGLPAENAAIERNILPHHWTSTNIQVMKKQLSRLGYDFDWEREICTSDPQYYKWTQYIFLQLFEKGLAYQSKANVNWDPVDKTVLADEQVDEFGCSWRSGAKVESKILTQWFIKTTKFAKELYDGLDSEKLESWRDIIKLQRHWIGECNGVVVTFKLKLGDLIKSLDIWTNEPFRFIHGQFITMKKNNVLIQELCSNINESKKITCYNPITGFEMPIYITNDSNYPPGRDVHICSPCTDEKDLHVAQQLNISLNKITLGDIEKDNQLSIDIAKQKNVGGYAVNSELKDWLISRQRYWGTPIPIIHCDSCGAVPVPYENLPVILPHFDSGVQILNRLSDWAKCTCPKCFKKAKRETDTMDTFVDSSWYYYRFLDPENKTKPFDYLKLTGRTPVDIYIGGKEHAVLHLYYARFMSYFLNSLGLTPTAEPFKKLIVQGMVMGQSYKLKSSGKYIPPEYVEIEGKQYKEKNTGEPVIVQWEKMSKSKHNGVNPERLLSAYGCDTTRLLILADVPPETSRHWSDDTLPGILNWQRRLWLTMREFLTIRKTFDPSSTKLPEEEFKRYEHKIWEARNYFIATTTYHFKHTHKLSVGISRLQSLTNTLRNNVPREVIAKSEEFEIALATLIIMLAPVAPHFSSELWSGLRSAPNRISNDLFAWNKNVVEQLWPIVDGADRCDLKMKAMHLNNLDSSQALNIMIKEESVAKRIKTGILKSKFHLYPGCRAILYIYTNRQNHKKQSKKVDITE